MKPTIPGRLDMAALGKLHPPMRPAAVCPDCWLAWLHAADRLPAGYCPHYKTAWRIRASGRVRTFRSTRLEFTDFLNSLKGDA